MVAPPDDRQQRRVLQAGIELLDEPLAAEEPLRVGGLERRQALVRTDIAEHARPRRPAFGGEQQRGVLREDGPLEVLADGKPVA